MGGYPGLRREWWNCSDLHTECCQVPLETWLHLR